MTWDEFEKKGYFVVPFPDDHKRTPAIRWFAEDRKQDTPDWGPHAERHRRVKGLQTPSGKIEFVSNSLKRFELDVDDPERPVMGPVHPVVGGPPTTELYDKYPLQMVSPHPRFSFHTMGDAKDAGLNEVKDHRVLVDGHYYWIMRMNTKDAEARGIKDGDLIRAYNDRGAVILAAQVTERVPPGTVHSYESCADYLPLGKPGESADIAGCINMLTPASALITPYVHRHDHRTPAWCRSRSGREETAMKNWNMIIDVARCHDCNNCFMACKDEHVGNDFPPYSAPSRGTAIAG